MESLITNKSGIRGVYLYRFRLGDHPPFEAGRLGLLHPLPGYYIYTGSALGGLGARIRRHRDLEPGGRLHWHIDYLSVLAEDKAFAVVETNCRIECDLNRVVGEMPAVQAAWDGFGCSDCRCSTHLHRLPGPVWPQYPGLRPWLPEIGKNQDGMV